MSAMKVTLRRVGVVDFEATNERGAKVRIGGSADLAERVLERVADRSALPDEATGASVETMRPMELFLVALASCGAMDVVLILTRQREPLRELTIEVEGDRAERTPSPYERIRLRFRAPGVDPKKLSRAATLGVKKYCSVEAMIDPAKVAVEVSVEG